MKLRPTHPSRRHQRGLSLIELMVSLVIGLIIMLAVTSAYLGSAGATRVAEAQARMNEDAQAALSILSQQLRMAGNNPKQPNYIEAAPRNAVYDGTTYIARGCDGTFSNITTAADIQSLTCAAGGGAKADSVAVSYEADAYNTIPTSAGIPTDCLGQALPVRTTLGVQVWDPAKLPAAGTVPKDVTFTVADNRYYVGTSTVVTAPSLYCKGSGGVTPQPLVENIEDIQFLYGTATAASTPVNMAVAGYLTASDPVAMAAPIPSYDAIPNDATLAALPSDAARWSKVLTVRICVVVRSEQQVVSDAASARYDKCDGTQNAAAPDLRLRRAYFTTVVLRNRVPS
jgi:type IV pilus assembly protein PilW